MPLKGSCHCGSVRIEVPAAPEWVGSCNCSICRKLGWLVAYYPDDGSVRIEGETARYIWGDRMISLHHCPVCGCGTHWESTGECKGKEILAPVVFQGGVAANVGMTRAFEHALGLPVQVPPYFNVMGAVGAAILAREAVARKGPSLFKGFGVADTSFSAGSFECSGCANQCEVVEISEKNTILARWGDRCGKWSSTSGREEKIS
jgi:hypothetical protein